MIIDVSFNWRHDDQTADDDSGRSAGGEDQGDFDITRPVAILKLADDTPSEEAPNPVVDPYDNDYWIKLPLQ